MDYWMFLAAGLFGAILGSFINALSFRFNTGTSILTGRSRCMSCNHQLAAWDLIPVVSYVLLRGRCRYCGAKISPQYPLVEVTGAGLSVGVAALHPVAAAYAFWLLVAMTLLFIVVYDMRHTIIPTSASVFLGVLALLSLFVQFGETFSVGVPTLSQILAGPLLALPLFLLSFVSGGRWMGWADSGLELSLGWLLGLSLGATALMVSFWIGAAVGVALMLSSRLVWRRGKKRLTMKSELPFAPFLVLGAVFVHFFHVDFFSSLTIFFY